MQVGGVPDDQGLVILALSTNPPSQSSQALIEEARKSQIYLQNSAASMQEWVARSKLFQALDSLQHYHLDYFMQFGKSLVIHLSPEATEVFEQWFNDTALQMKNSWGVGDQSTAANLAKM